MKKGKRRRRIQTVEREEAKRTAISSQLKRARPQESQVTPGQSNRSTSALLTVQRSLGNRTVRRLIRSGAIQPPIISGQTMPLVQRQKGKLTDFLATDRPSPRELWMRYFFDTTLGLTFIRQYTVSAAQEYDEIAKYERQAERLRRAGRPVPPSLQEDIQNCRNSFIQYAKDAESYIEKLHGKRLKRILKKKLWKFLRLVNPTRTLKILTRSRGITPGVEKFFDRLEKRTDSLRKYTRSWS